jgi:alanine racemase
VACVEEALALREAGIDRRILLLEGVFEADELPWCARMPWISPSITPSSYGCWNLPGWNGRCGSG